MHDKEAIEGLREVIARIEEEKRDLALPPKIAKTSLLLHLLNCCFCNL
jgi:hypothetical protein